jgi:hypothetical protein
VSTAVHARHRVFPGLVGLAAFGLVLAALVVIPNVDIVASGHLVPYTEREVHRVDVFGLFTVLAAPETRIDTDLLNTIVLGGLAGVALLAACLAAPGRLRRFFAFAAAGAAVACFDEGFELTESIVYNIDWAGAFGFSPRKLDVLDAIPVALFAWYFRDLLLSSTRALWFLGTGIALFAGALVLEVTAETRLEDAAEVVSSASVAVGLTILAVELLGRSTGSGLQPGRSR